MKKLFIFISFALLLTTKSNAQKKIIYQHEYGGNLGISNSQNDYIAKGPFDGKLTINGMDINASHYLHFLPRRYGASPIYKYLVIKSSLGINLSNYDNKSYGTENEPLTPPNTPNSILLGKLSTKTTLISFDNEAQFYFKDIIQYLHKRNRYRSKSKVNPYVAVGLGINYVNAVTSYAPEQLPDGYDTNTFSDGGTIAVSGNFAFGARYKATTKYDLVAQMGFKYFLSDYIDGINPDVPSNEINDFNTVISVGFIYHMF